MEHKKTGAIPRLVIAAPHSGSGKTTLTMGIMAAFCRKGLTVQPFKVGPDYIDPAFHTAITGRTSINLDGWMLEEDYIKQMFVRYSQETDLSVIEGVMGLYDGYGDDIYQGSTAGMAKILQAPVVLVIPAKGMAATAAALVYGMKEFGGINIAAVVINQLSSANHYAIIKNAIEKHTGVKVVGYLPKTDGIELKSRHLGLVQSSEREDLPQIVETLADLISRYIDLDELLEIARKSEEIDTEALSFPRTEKSGEVSIAVAWDKAFSFYYHENLEILKRLGADLKYFSPIKDHRLPSGCSGIYFGGGYPEVFAPEVAANEQIKKEIFQAAQAGMPIYAECGGYMYLNRSYTSPEGDAYKFVGIFDGDAVMTGKLQNFGYVELTGLQDTVLFHRGDEVRGHEFHRSIIPRVDQDFGVRAKKIKEGKTVEWECGRKYKNVYGMYPHVYFPSNMSFARTFVDKCREFKENAAE